MPSFCLCYCNFLIALFACTGTENTLAVPFKIQEVYHISCKLSLLILTKIIWITLVYLGDKLDNLIYRQLDVIVQIIWN